MLLRFTHARSNQNRSLINSHQSSHKADCSLTRTMAAAIVGSASAALSTLLVLVDQCLPRWLVCVSHLFSQISISAPVLLCRCGLRRNEAETGNSSLRLMPQQRLRCSRKFTHAFPVSVVMFNCSITFVWQNPRQSVGLLMQSREPAVNC